MINTLERVRTYSNYLTVVDKLQFNIRRISYYTGALLLITAAEADIDLFHSVGQERRSVFEILAGRLQPKQPKKISNADIVSILQEELQNRKTTISSFLSKNPVKAEGSYYISGYDPMNMIRYNDYILCSRIIKLSREQTDDTLMFMGKTLPEMEEGSLNWVKAYYR